ncbi:MAG: M56 family metallopeptidase [Actinomycetota bacterium]
MTLPVVMILRRLIHRGGGFASGVLAGLPLLLPLIAALMFRRPVLPEIAILRPATLAVLERSGSLGQLLLLETSGAPAVTPYAVTGSAGAWLLWIAVVMSCVMLLRRVLGTIVTRRLVEHCRPLDEAQARRVGVVLERLAAAAHLRVSPAAALLPAGASGAFTVGGRRPRVLLSDCVLESLEDDELEAVLAHEVAHLRAHDLRVVFAAGWLRDVVAWNPIAHIAYRHLLVDRELEADRYAASITGRPLVVASSLLKVCELVGPRRVFSSGLALGFSGRPRRVVRRVSRLLALADSGVTERSSTAMPFVAAALLAALLALQVGVRMTSPDHPALALVWGAPRVATGDPWTADDASWKIRKASTGHTRGASGKRGLRGPLDASKRSVQRFIAARAVNEKDFDVWMRAFLGLARSNGVPPTLLRAEARQAWRAELLFAEPSFGSFGLYHVERASLLAGTTTAPGRPTDL